MVGSGAVVGGCSGGDSGLVGRASGADASDGASHETVEAAHGGFLLPGVGGYGCVPVAPWGRRGVGGGVLGVYP